MADALQDAFDRATELADVQPDQAAALYREIIASGGACGGVGAHPRPELERTGRQTLELLPAAAPVCDVQDSGAASREALCACQLIAPRHSRSCSHHLYPSPHSSADAALVGNGAEGGAVPAATAASKLREAAVLRLVDLLVKGRCVVLVEWLPPISLAYVLCARLRITNQA